MELESVIVAIERAADIASLTAMLGEWRDSSGLAHLAYHAFHVPISLRPNPVLMATYDSAWLRRYLDEDYFRIDPIVIASSKGFLPIDWMTIDRDTSVAKQFFDEAEAHGVCRHGLTLPLRGPRGERALFTINSNESDHYWHRRRYSYMQEFHVVAYYLHDRAMQLAGMRADYATRPLSRRERQCVQGLANGHTPQQIGSCLNVSPSAVHLYLGAARRKLNCARIDQAVAKAICFELVQYSDLH